MALKSIGILIALCATLSAAIDQVGRFPLRHDYYHKELNNDKNVGYGSYKPSYPNNFENSGGRGHHNYLKLHFPESGEWGHQSFSKPYFPHSFHGIGHHTSPTKPNFPQSFYGSGEGQYSDISKPNIPHSLHGSEGHQSGFSQLNFPHSSHGLSQGQQTGSSQPNFLHNLHEMKDQHNGPTKPNFPHSTLPFPDKSEAQRSGSGNYPHSSHVSEGGQHTGFLQPNFFHISQGLAAQHAGLTQQNFPHSNHGSEAVTHTGFSQSNFPHNVHGSGQEQQTGFSQSNFPHSSHGSQGYHASSSQLNFPHNNHGQGYHASSSQQNFPRNNHGHHASFLQPNTPHSSHGSLGQHTAVTQPNFPHSLHGVEELKNHGHPKPSLPHNSEGLGEHHDLSKPHLPHDSHELGGLHTLPKPHSPDSTAGSGEHHDIHKPHDTHNHETEEHDSHNPRFSRSSQEQNWKSGSYDFEDSNIGYKLYRPDWYNPHFPQPPVQLVSNFEEMERRRPIFYPIYPYHFYSPHVHPSTNDEEFETIEAFKGINNNESLNDRDFELTDDSAEVLEQQKYKGPDYHGHHNPNFPTYSPFHHGFPHHFNPFHKEPEHSEENVDFPPMIFDGPYINGDDFPTSDEAQPYELSSPTENSEHFQGPFVIIGNGEDYHKLPSILLDILEHLHHEHGKPHHHGDHKPNGGEDENEIDVDGSGEEELIPLFSEAKVPLMSDDDLMKIND